MKITQRLNFKITSRFIALFVLAFAVLIITVSSLFTEKLHSELVLVAQQKLNVAATSLSHSLSEIKALHSTVGHDIRLQSLMQEYAQNAGKPPAATEHDDKWYAAEIRERLAQIVSPYASVRSAVMIAPDCKILDPIYSSEPYAAALLRGAEYDKFTASQLNGRFSAPNTFPYIVADPSYSQLSTVTYLGHFYNSDTYEELGALAINFSKLALTTQMEPTFSTGFDYVFVANEADVPVLRSESCPDTVPQEIMGASGGGIVQSGGRSYTVFSEPVSNYYNWRVYGVIDYQSILSPVRRITYITAITAFLVLLLTFITGTRVASSITRPLSRIAQAMSSVRKGKWETVPEPEELDEVGELTLGYNKMVASLEQMEERIREEQSAKKEIEIAMLQSRLDLLQSQINPHFIHNTLNTMNYMAQKDGAYDLSRLIVSFNGLLRTSMSTQNMLNTVADEIENLRRYIEIQLSRYDIDLRCVYDVSDEAQLVMLPKLILQPLVENSLFHGIVPKGGGTITVRACVENERLWVAVIDDGAGITAARVHQIMEGTLPNTRGYSSIGLPNVSDRLVLAYGEASRLVVESEENHGTTISFSAGL